MRLAILFLCRESAGRVESRGPQGHGASMDEFAADLIGTRHGKLKRLRVALALAATLLGLSAAWFWGSPWWTLHQMREAALRGDAVRLAAYVDFEAVTARERADFRAFWASVLTSVRSDTENGRSFRATATRMLENVGGARIGSEDIRPWLAGSYQPMIERLSLSEFRVKDANDPQNGGSLTFRRHGFGWKLVAVQFGQQ
jgi:hypothetical protein